MPRHSGVRQAGVASLGSIPGTVSGSVYTALSLKVRIGCARHCLD